MQNCAEGSYLPDQNVLNVNKTEEKGNNQTQEDKGRKKNKKSVSIEFTIQIVVFVLYNCFVCIKSSFDFCYLTVSTSTVCKSAATHWGWAHCTLLPAWW